jgi:hypothetical protein
VTDGAVGLTVTDVTGSVTVTAALPVFVSLVAMMFAVPAATAVTRPVDGSTVATAVLSEDQVTVRPESGWLFASSGVAVNVLV